MNQTCLDINVIVPYYFKSQLLKTGFFWIHSSLCIPWQYNPVQIWLSFFQPVYDLIFLHVPHILWKNELQSACVRVHVCTCVYICNHGYIMLQWVLRTFCLNIVLCLNLLSYIFGFTFLIVKLIAAYKMYKSPSCTKVLSVTIISSNTKTTFLLLYINIHTGSYTSIHFTLCLIGIP